MVRAQMMLFKRLFSLAPKYGSKISLEIVGKDSNIALLKLNDPRTLNKLSSYVIEELIQKLGVVEKDKSIQLVMLTGNGRAFSQGADILEMVHYTYEDVKKMDFPKAWYAISQFKKPKISAVNGFCFGGGFEISMMFDAIIGSKKAVFSLPEIKIGTIPGCGGTQRLPRLVGKSLAMELILTGDRLSATEALEAKVISKIVEPEDFIAFGESYIQNNI
uniref:Enoyl-CoA hydratase n=1 Tax=Rhabditophanes sp. KR3021 TaxID=114890 RepID=A0AC35UAS4_9BILA